MTMYNKTITQNGGLGAVIGKKKKYEPQNYKHLHLNFCYNFQISPPTSQFFFIKTKLNPETNILAQI